MVSLGPLAPNLEPDATRPQRAAGSWRSKPQQWSCPTAQAAGRPRSVRR